MVVLPHLGQSRRWAFNKDRLVMRQLPVVQQLMTVMARLLPNGAARFRENNVLTRHMVVPTYHKQIGYLLISCDPEAMLLWL